MDEKNFRLISGFAKLSQKVKNMVNIWVSANVFGGHMD